MRAGYTDDARITVTWFAGSIDEYVESSRNPEWESTARSWHRLAPSMITVAGDRALAETPARVELRLELDGVLVDLTACVRLLSRVVRTADGWKLASMDAIYEKYEKDAVVPVHPGDRLAISSEQTNGYRKSYRFNGQVRAAGLGSWR